MNLLFIQGGSRLKQDEEGNWYTDPNFNDDVWKRYVDLGDSLTIMLRRESRIYTKEHAQKRFNKVLDDPRIRIVPLRDFSESKITMLNPYVYYCIRDTIYKEVEKADKCFIRSGSHYTKVAYNACMKYGVPYLFEATGFAYESFSKHSFLGRLVANKVENDYRIMSRDAVQATYVTNIALQKRYPCATGKMLGVSNVQLLPPDERCLKQKLEHFDKKDCKTLVIGTAAFLDVKWKGQELVIRALGELKKKGIRDIRYELIGMGTGNYLMKVAKECDVEDQIKIIGTKRHDEVFAWLDGLDVYIQSSYQEGLCRAIIEAMSRALPVICSDTGGNFELIDKEYLFKCGDYKTLAMLIEKIRPNLKEQAMKNFEHSKDYEKKRLDDSRKSFFKEFINA